MKIYKMIVATILLVVLIGATIYCLLNTGYEVHNNLVYNDNAEEFMLLSIGFGLFATLTGLTIVFGFKNDKEEDDE